MIQYLSQVRHRSAIGYLFTNVDVLPNASDFLGHLQTSQIFGPCAAIGLVTLNGLAQWYNSQMRIAI